MLIENPKGNFRFVKGFGPVSFDCIADPGFEIVHATFWPLLPMQNGFDRIESHLRSIDRPLNALCGIELRIPEPLSPQEFAKFNQPYQEKLERWGLAVGGLNPVSRTNVAYELASVAEPSLYAFSYTALSSRPEPTFVFAGMPEILPRSNGGFEIAARDDVSPGGMRKKIDCIVKAISASLSEMNASWTDVTTLDVYTAHDIHAAMAPAIFAALKTAGRYGIRWHFARQPVTGLEIEIGIRAVHQELMLS